MSAIKPGSLCVIVNSQSDVAEKVNGRIVEAVRRDARAPGCWVIDAAWIREMLKVADAGPLDEAIIDEYRLSPIDDPSSATNSYYTCVVHI